jgi:hypothetical protein
MSQLTKDYKKVLATVNDAYRKKLCLEAVKIFDPGVSTDETDKLLDSIYSGFPAM